MSWTAVIPLKRAAERKRRLAGRLSPTQRAALAARLFVDVAAELRRVPRLRNLVVLSPDVPERWMGGWVEDRGRGLNAELEAARDRLRAPRLLVIHADLPLLRAAEVEELLSAAEAAGLALAPDRHDTGTNALAIADGRPFAFRFGCESLARHLAQADGCCRVVRRPGLALDLDTPEDLDAALALGALVTA